MQMTSEEIKRSYLNATDQKEQIGILADLNLCQKDDIRNILIEQEIPEEELPKKRGRKKKQEDPVVVPDPVKDQKDKMVIPMRVRAALHGVLREKDLQLKQLLRNKEATEKAIVIIQEDISEINHFLEEGDSDEKEQK